MSAQDDRNAILSQVREYYKKHIATQKPARIPASGKSFDENEVANAVEAALDCWWTEGRFTDAFVEKFKSFLGIKYVSVMNSGSSANLIALSALFSTKLGDRRLKPGDEVITVASAFPTTVNPILQCGLVPVFCDIDLETHNIDVSMMKKALSKKTKAVMLAHSLGNPFNISAISKFCKDNGLWLVADCCDALGATYQGKTVASFADVSTFSFYPAHHITMGEGGAVVTDNPLIYKISNSIRDWGRDCWCRTGKDNTCGRRFSMQFGELPFGYDHKYVYSELGYNLKATDFQAALGVAQMDKLPGFISKRRQNHKSLMDGLKKYFRYFIFQKAEPQSEPSWFGFLITLKDGCGFKREELTSYLEQNGIGTRLVFSGNIIRQPYFTQGRFKYRVVGELANTDKSMKDTFWVGVFPVLSKKETDLICERIRDFLTSKGLS